MSRGPSAYMGVPRVGPVGWDGILIRDLHPEDYEYEVVWSGTHGGSLLPGVDPAAQAKTRPNGVAAGQDGHYRRPVADVIKILEKSFRRHGSQTLVEVCRRTGLKAPQVNHALRKGGGRICRVASLKKVAIYGLAQGVSNG